MYGPDFGTDFQAPYFRDWLARAGIEDVSEVRFRPNLAIADVGAARASAHQDAREVAKRFAVTD